jgi:hypothetical protein
MANIISATEVMGGGGLYLDKSAKAELHQQQRPFFITHAVGEQEGQFGPQTIFTIREKGKDEAKLAFGVSPARKELAEKISVAIANGADGVGPFYLGRWENGTRSGWTLTPEPTKVLEIPETSGETRDRETTERKAKADAFAADLADSDIPF